ncbi:MAG: hypothetical protein LBJ89_01870 [Holosporales bacterium]|jgi:hypothetical protein|nr:hypothetical protein [Holosporales bacterium]
MENRLKTIDMTLNCFKYSKIRTIYLGLAITCFINEMFAAATVFDQEHLFDINGNVRIDDEGFRWKNSFDFTISCPTMNGFPALVNQAPATWLFNGVANQNANSVHTHLSDIVARIIATRPGNVINQAAAAAITIVIRNPNNGNLEAYSKVIEEDLETAPGIAPAPAVAIPSGQLIPQKCDAITGAGFSMYYTDIKQPPKVTIANHLRITGTLFQSNVSEYHCCEGQIIARLFDTNPPTVTASALHQSTIRPHSSLFPITIANLIAQAKATQVANAAQITDAAIVLVVLHIHSHQDPCARCSEVLSGLSRQMNLRLYDAAVPEHNKQAQKMTNLLRSWTNVGLLQLITNLENGNAAFLIELSSNKPFVFGTNHSNRCSSAEFSGQSGNTGRIPNINISGVCPAAAQVQGQTNVANQLAIPRRLLSNTTRWQFNPTFPPYVIYSRITPGMGAPTIGAPAACRTILHHPAIQAPPIPVASNP